MEPDELKHALETLGVKDPTDVEEVTRKVRAIYLNNMAAIFPNPKDNINKLIEIDYDMKHLVFMHMNNNRWRKQVRAFNTIEGLDGLAEEVPEGRLGGVIEYEDGSYRDTGMSEDAQKAQEQKQFTGSIINELLDQFN